LTDLYEQARFSTHDIDLGMRAEAVDLLERIRADLAEVARPAEIHAGPRPVRA
jgi:hypothetical protein